MLHMLGSWFSRWIEQYDRLPLIHLCRLFYSPLHTQTDTIHRAEGEGSLALFMRCIAQNATGFSWGFKTAHTVFGLPSVSLSLSHAQLSYTLATKHLFTLCAASAWQRYSCLNVTLTAYVVLPACACWLRCISVLHERSDIICMSEKQKGYCMVRLHQITVAAIVCWKMLGYGILLSRKPY